MSYSLKQVAERYGVHIETVRRWVRDGRLKAHHRIGKGIGLFVTEEELKRFEISVEGVQSDGGNEEQKSRMPYIPLS